MNTRSLLSESAQYAIKADCDHRANAHISDPLDNPSIPDTTGIPLRLLGYGVLMGLHFLILFFPVPLAEGESLTGNLFVRQILLNCSLCGAFIVFGSFLDKALITSKNHGLFIVTIGSVATTIGIAVFLFSVIANVQFLMIPSVIVIGAGEALLLLMWLSFYSETSVNYTARYLAASMVIGSLICFLTNHLQPIISFVVIMLLPVLSGSMLYLAMRNTKQRSQDTAGKGITNWSEAKSPFMQNTLQLAVYSFVFGFFQGSVTPSSTLLPVSDPSSILGVGIAGLFIVAMLPLFYVRRKTSIIFKVSALLFFGGLLFVPFSDGLLAYLSATATMTGFILLDVRSLMLMVDLSRTFDLSPAKFIGINRSMEYGAFAVGIGLGFFIWNRFSGDILFPFMIVAIACFFVGAITLAFLNEGSIWSKDPALVTGVFDKDDAEELHEHESQSGRFKASCQKICDDHGLSPRESEIMLLVAKGRNAEYIQKSLFISNHTAKTHIANIYKKLEIHSAQALIDMVEHTKDLL